MHVLILCAAGMVGRKLTERLLRDGRLGNHEITRMTLQDVVAPTKPAHASIPITVVASDFADAGAAAPLIAHRPEVIFLDIGLPGIDGYEVARRLRNEAGLTESKLIALSGYGTDAEQQRSREAGFNRHLGKPVDPGELPAIIAQVTGATAA